MKRVRFTWIAYAIMICSLTTFAQPDTLWTRELRYDPMSGGHWIIDLSEDDDGNIAVVLSDTTREFVIAKFSAMGDSLWSHAYRDSNNPLEVWRATTLANHSIAAIGMSYSTSPPFVASSKVFVVDSSGNLVISRQVTCQADYSTVLAPCPEGGAVVAQRHDGSILVFKYDDEFNEMWSIEVTDSVYTYPKDIDVDEQGKILIAKVDGATLIDEDGGVIWSNSFDGGDSVWFAIDRCAARNGEYWIAGERSTDNFPYTECWVVKYDDAGDSVFNRTFSFYPDFEGFWPLSIDIIEGNDLLLSGLTGHGELVFRVDENGELVWSACCEDNNWYGRMESLVVLSDNGFVTAHWSDHDSVKLIRTEPDIITTALNRVLPSDFGLHPNYPNPFNATTEIRFDLPRAMQTSLKVYDVLGREVAELAGGVMNAGSHTILYDASGLSSGVYFYRLEAGEFGETRKMVLLK